MTDLPDAPANNPAPAPLADHHAELRPELRNWCEAWKTCLQNVLSQISGDASGQPTVFEISSEPLPPTDSDLWYTVVAGGAAHGEMTLRLSAASATRLARKFVGETDPAPEGITEGITADHKEALEELLRQIAGLAATALAATAGGGVQFHLAASAAPSWSSDAIVCLRTRNEAEGDVSIAIEIQISPALAAALQPRVQPGSPAPTSAPASPPSSALRRLMDVGLDVKLRFGTRRMLLGDVLALNPGVVVELDSTINSPVDLLLDDGRLIAHGDVVVVDGKYGLRVTEVVDPAPSPGSPG